MKGEEIFNALCREQQHRAGNGGASSQENVIIGESDALKRVWCCIYQVSSTYTTVLFLC